MIAAILTFGLRLRVQSGCYLRESCLSRILSSGLAVVLLWTVLFQGPAFAQAEDDEFEDEFALLEDQDVVVSAAKHKQKTGFSPAAVIIITRREIEASGALDLMDLLRRYPAVDVYEFDPMYPAAEIRGSYRVMMMIDGREINLELFVAPFFGILPIGLSDIERIEIVLGPNSAIYGANAVSAVINVVTREPPKDLQAGARLSAGEHGDLRTYAAAAGEIGPVAARASLGYDRADFWMVRDSRAKQVMRGNATARIKLPGGDLSLDGGICAARGRMFALAGYLDAKKVVLAYAQARAEFGDLSLRAYWYGLRTDLDIELLLTYPALGLELGTVPTLDIYGDTGQVEAQYDLEPFKGNLLILGVDVRVTRYHSDQFVDPNTTIWEERAGAYFHDEQRIGDRLLLQAGLRFDWNSRTDFAVSPRGAIVYNPAGEHYLRLSGGTAFRKPTIMETSTNFKVDANPAFPEIKELFEVKGVSRSDLANEFLATVEFGYHGTMLDRKLRLGADAYMGFTRDQIGFRSDVDMQNTPLGPKINVDNSKIGYDTNDEDTDNVGMYLSAEYEPLAELSLFCRADLKYAWLVKQDNKEYRSYPRFIVSLGGRLSLSRGLRINLAARLVGSTDTWIRNPYSIVSPSVPISMPTRVNILANVGYRFDFAGGKLELGINLFDPLGERFREEAGVLKNDGENYGGEVLGRRIMLTAAFDY